MQTSSPPGPSAVSAQTTTAPLTVVMSAGDASMLFRDARKHLLVPEIIPRTTCVPEERFRGLYEGTRDRFPTKADRTMNALLQTAQCMFRIAARRFPNQEPTAEIIKATFDNRRVFFRDRRYEENVGIHHALPSGIERTRPQSRDDHGPFDGN